MISFSEDAALRLTGSHHNVIKDELMDEEPTMSPGDGMLRGMKPRSEFDNGDVIELLLALDCAS